ncbi:hypothetical protein [Luteibacter sp. CQ10]|uniref:hypothetical protein n=1 Tax=Luteibacter sp. CQ10 TaxID=2805821 RepID=UPI0034A18BDB
MHLFPSPVSDSSIIVARHRPPVGAVSTEPDPSRRSGRLDLSHALSPSDVHDLLLHWPLEDAEKPWHVFAPRLMLGMALTAKDIALLDTRQFAFRHGRAWLSFPKHNELEQSPRAVRSVPLHVSLEALRLPGFAHSRYFAEGREGPLFPDLAEAKRPGDAIDSWMRRSTRWLADAGRHAPTPRDLRATCAQAALDGGASVDAVETLMGLRVSSWDDRGPTTQQARAQLQDERLREAVEAVHLPGLNPAELALSRACLAPSVPGRIRRAPSGNPVA